MSVGEEKIAARRLLRGRVAAMGVGERAERSARVRAALLGSAWWRDAGVVMVYGADETEPDLDAVIAAGTAAGKTVCVARVDWEGKRLLPCVVRGAGELVAGRHGVREPDGGAEAVGIGSVGLVVAPGVGFDRAGSRLGRGGGFYDRFLADRSMGAVVVGACFGVQVVDRLPGEAHDRRVDGLVTDAGVVVCDERIREGRG